MKKDKHFKEGPISPFEFEKEDISLQLRDSVSGWSMTKLNSLKVCSITFCVTFTIPFLPR